MTQLAIREWGDGDRVAVLIHGLSARAELWTAVAVPLADLGYRVVAPDLRGHGRSPRGSYSVHEWVSDILDVVPTEPDLAIGHSLGGVLLLEALPAVRPRRAVYVDPPWIAPIDPGKRVAETARAAGDFAIDELGAAPWAEGPQAADTSSTRAGAQSRAYRLRIPVQGPPGSGSAQRAGRSKFRR